MFDSVEQAFQYAKTFFSVAPVELLSKVRSSILAARGGAELRRIGKTIPSLDVAGWDKASPIIMKDLLLQSFYQNPAAAEALVATMGKELTHDGDTSRWHDLFPSILMEVRETIASEMEEIRANALKDVLVTEKESAEETQKEPKVYISYYGSRNFPKDAYLVQISTSCPENMTKDMDVCFKTLYPDYDTMVKPFKNGDIDEKEYTRRYNENILKPNKDKIISGMNSIISNAKEEGVDICLLCYCRPGAFCHRYLVNNFLNENGIVCEELPEDRLKYQVGHIALYGEKPVEDLFSQGGGEKPVEMKPLSSDEKIVFTESEGNYAVRTEENANGDEVDFTLALAVDFNTAGERCTAKAAGESLISAVLLLKEKGGLDLSSKALDKTVSQLCSQFPTEFLKGEPCGLNIAGNGIYTLSKSGISQDDIDLFVCELGNRLQKKGMVFSSVRCGGQTGVDEAGAVMGLVFDIPTIVHAPKGWAYRDILSVDHRGDRDAFVKRFDLKDLSKLRSLVMKTVKIPEKKPSGVKLP